MSSNAWIIAFVQTNLFAAGGSAVFDVFAFFLPFCFDADVALAGRFSFTGVWAEAFSAGELCSDLTINLAPSRDGSAGNRTMPSKAGSSALGAVSCRFVVGAVAWGFMFERVEGRSQKAIEIDVDKPRVLEKSFLVLAQNTF
ncbi:hypothetical protein V7S43_018001 [Phytophthora oleae]|uniref:Uncharacterized protein n=1 Tax=Phytophthora oleae TaxID=2107226 RepID=A0ABD3ERK2_9STRA